MNRKMHPSANHVQLEILGRVAQLTIDNPPMNLMTREVLLTLGTCIRELDEERGIRAVIIRGAGDKLFTAGADLAQIGAALLHAPSHELQAACMAWLTEVQATLQAIEQSPKAYLVAMKGISYGGGMELAAACDLRIAATNARFALPEARLGLLPGYGGTQRLARLIGPGRAKHWVLTAREIPAPEAHMAGFVDVLCDPGQESMVALNVAEEICRLGPLAVRGIKQAYHSWLRADLDEGLQREQRLFANLVATEDAQEGLRAFHEKRAAKFQGC